MSNDLVMRLNAAALGLPGYRTVEDVRPILREAATALAAPAPANGEAKLIAALATYAKAHNDTDADPLTQHYAGLRAVLSLGEAERAHLIEMCGKAADALAAPEKNETASYNLMHELRDIYEAEHPDKDST